jgi:CubicO group peptidase (beta-lactamase class C family)
MKYSILFVFVFCLVCRNTALGQSVFSKKQLRLLDSIATQDVPPSAPGIATAILKGGKVVYEKYAGYANLSDSSLINPSTRFNIASNGKQFTALALLNLIERKKLRLSDDIRIFLPSLFPQLKDKITVQSLLNHTSGIRDCYDLWSLMGYTWWEKTFSNKDVLSLLEKQQDLNFKPNSSYLYSNTN